MIRALRVLGLLLVGLVVAIPTSGAVLLSTERAITIGAHTATARPTLDGFVTVLAGPLLPEVRFPASHTSKVGVRIILRDGDTANLEQILMQDAAIASQPQGEIASVTREVQRMVVRALIKGSLVGLLSMMTVGIVWRGIGLRRRREIAMYVRSRRGNVTVVTLGLLLSMTLTITILMPVDSERQITWIPIREAYPLLPEEPILEQVMVSQGAAVAGSQAIVKGALDTYTESVDFYRMVAEKAESLVLPQPTAEQKVAVVVTDRHDNIGMDQVARAIADAAGASIVIDLGDDTSSGATWEAFSINSLRAHFEGFPIVAVAGNHDQGPNVVKDMERNRFHVLDGEPFTVEGITFIGQSDPRSSGLTAGYNGNESENSGAIQRQSLRLSEAACASEDARTLIVHSSASARDTIAQGCVDLVLSGHLHREIPPKTTEGLAGSVTSWGLGSTGGAAYAFALGSKLRRNAQVGLVTYEEGVPIGLQAVTIEPGGILSVGEWTAVGS